MCSYIAPTKSPTGKVLKGKRNVRFDLDEETCDPAGKRIHSYQPITPECYDDCYWSSIEIREIQLQQVVLAQEFAEAAQELIDSIHLLYGLHDNEASAPVCCDAQYEAARKNLAQSESRGLEQLLTPFLIQHRSCYIAKLLDIQHQLQICGKSPSLIAAVLSDFCVHVSGAPNQFAHQLALGDQELVNYERIPQEENEKMQQNDHHKDVKEIDECLAETCDSRNNPVLSPFSCTSGLLVSGQDLRLRRSGERALFFGPRRCSLSAAAKQAMPRIYLCPDPNS
jgi:hypothetical protein